MAGSAPLGVLVDREAVARRHGTGRSSWIRPLGRFCRRRPLAATGGLIVVSFLLVAVIAPLLATDNPSSTNPSALWALPGSAHLLGGDHLGRDIFSRVVYGARVSYAVGFGATLIGLSLATAFGVVSGYFRGWFDTLFQRLIDIAISFPFLILLLSVTQILPKGIHDWVIGPVHIGPAMRQAVYITATLGVALAFASSRVIRSATFVVKSRQYVDAARTLGASDRRIIVRYVLPNIMPVTIVLGTVYVGAAILIESSLAFLGFGLPPTIPSWGQMLNDSRPALSQALNPSIWPGLAITLSVWGFNMLGDGLRDVLDPRLRGSRS